MMEKATLAKRVEHAAPTRDAVLYTMLHATMSMYNHYHKDVSETRPKTYLEL